MTGRPAPDTTLEARLTHAGRHQAAQLNYRVTGMRGFDTIGPAKAVGWFSLTRGSLVVGVDGPDCEHTWHATLDLGEEGYAAMRARYRAA